MCRRIILFDLGFVIIDLVGLVNKLEGFRGGVRWLFGNWWNNKSLWRGEVIYCEIVC